MATQESTPLTILIAGNRNRDHNFHLKLHLDLSRISLGGSREIQVTDLWSEGTVKTYMEADLGNFACTVKRDGLQTVESQP